MIRRLDARGLRCPWPALRAAAAMRESEVVEIRVDDPAAPDEIASLVAARGWTICTEKPGILVLSASPANESLSSITVD